MSDFESYLSHCLDTLEHSRVREAMQYSLMAGGKRIRPRLLLAVLRAYGFEETIGYPVAAAIEMIFPQWIMTRCAEVCRPVMSNSARMSLFWQGMPC